MELLSINNILKKDIPLFYRNEYFADAEFKIFGDRTEKVTIDFVVEMSPIGEKLISVNITNKPDYPTLPLMKLLKDKIRIMEEEGRLR